jgi:hypothetical protein
VYVEQEQVQATACLGWAQRLSRRVCFGRKLQIMHVLAALCAASK